MAGVPIHVTMWHYCLDDDCDPVPVCSDQSDSDTNNQQINICHSCLILIESAAAKLSRLWLKILQNTEKFLRVKIFKLVTVKTV